MTKQAKTHGTSNEENITDAVIDRLADSAERGYEPDQLRPRGGRRLMGSAPADVVPVRLDPELRHALDVKAKAVDTSMSDIIRTALRAFLDVA